MGEGFVLALLVGWLRLGVFSIIIALGNKLLKDFTGSKNATHSSENPATYPNKNKCRYAGIFIKQINSCVNTSHSSVPCSWLLLVPPRQCSPPSLQMAIPANNRSLGGWSCAIVLRGGPQAGFPVCCATALPNHEFWACQHVLESDLQTWEIHKNLQRSWVEGSWFRLRETSPWLSSAQGLEKGKRKPWQL